MRSNLKRNRHDENYMRLQYMHQLQPREWSHIAVLDSLTDLITVVVFKTRQSHGSGAFVSTTG